MEAAAALWPRPRDAVRVLVVEALVALVPPVDGRLRRLFLLYLVLDHLADDAWVTGRILSHMLDQGVFVLECVAMVEGQDARTKRMALHLIRLEGLHPHCVDARRRVMRSDSLVRVHRRRHIRARAVVEAQVPRHISLWFARGHS